MISLFERLLKYYNFTVEDYKTWASLGREDDIPKPNDDKFFAMIERIKSAIKNGEKIVIYGDYDADGITATSIMYLTLKELGAEVGYFIPSRYVEGYGLYAARVDQFAEKGYKLLITVDNGVSRFDEVKRAKDKGMDVIIIDHHTIQDKLPTADFIFHQTYSHVTDYNISAAFLSLIVSHGLLGSYNPYYIVLAGIAALSDSMPLTGANVALLRLTFRYIEKYKYYNILSLGTDPIIDENYLNYQIIPKLNAIGRIETTIRINDAVKFLTSNDQRTISYYASRLDAYNKKRKELTSSFNESNIRYVGGACIYESSLPLGLGGLLANRIMTEKKLPTIVLSRKDDEVVASLRTPENYDIIESLKDLEGLDEFGGHKNAAGLSFPYSKKEEMIIEISSRLLPSKDNIKRTAIELNIDEITSDSYKLITSFGPYGNNHPSPIFHLQISNQAFHSFTSNPKHIVAKVSDVTIIYFNGRDKLNINGYTDLYGHFNLNIYKGKTTLQFIVDFSTSENEIILIK